jgi:hypothetical protein
MMVHLHVGAHKTATTFLQSTLAANATGLADRGIAYMPLAATRRHLTPHLAGSGRLRLDGQLRRFFSAGGFATPRGMVISDENIIGGCGSFITTGRLYAKAGPRLERLRDALPGCEFTLFFSVRAYDSFLASAYCEALRHAGAFAAFDEFRKRLDREYCRWPAVLERLVDALRPKEVVVWRYEDFRANATVIMRKLAFNIGEPLKPSKRKAERASFSQTAIDVLALVDDRYGPLVSGRLIRPVRRHFPKGADHAPFDPWSDAERGEWRALYELDCTNLPVPLLSFPSPAAA